MTADLMRLIRRRVERLRIPGVAVVLLMPPVTCWLWAYIFSGREAMKGFCPRLVDTGVALMIVAAVVVAALALWKPWHLASEELQMKRKALDIVEQKASTVRVPPATFLKLIDPIIRPLAGRARDH